MLTSRKTHLHDVSAVVNEITENIDAAIFDTQVNARLAVNVALRQVRTGRYKHVCETDE